MTTTETAGIADLTNLHHAALEAAISERSGKSGSRTIRKLLKYAAKHPTLTIEPDDRAVWIWSDLHLRHANIIKYCDRPFDTVDEMDRQLLATWKSTVGPGDVILNAGDVALAGRLTGQHLQDVRRAPGMKILVAGNHEFNRKNRSVTPHGHDAVAPMAIIRSDPALVITHVPLLEVPPGWLNVHGHVHNKHERSDRHINVCVEKTGYHPIRLETILEKARRRNRARAAIP